MTRRNDSGQAAHSWRRSRGRRAPSTSPARGVTLCLPSSVQLCYARRVGARVAVQRRRTITGRRGSPRGARAAHAKCATNIAARSLIRLPTGFLHSITLYSRVIRLIAATAPAAGGSWAATHTRPSANVETRRVGSPDVSIPYVTQLCIRRTVADNDQLCSKLESLRCSTAHTFSG